jgi:SAM-dependent methyltransferase
MTVEQGYFRECYAASPDPWGLADRWYEARKYAISIAMLPREHYGTAFEPGCSIGVLTAKLAARCGVLLSCDAVEEAVVSAQGRTAATPGVRVEHRLIPRDWPTGTFDLIVFSEFLYYFGDADLDQVLGLAVGSLRPNGHLLAVHWRHPAPDHPRTGDATHQALASFGALTRLAEYHDPDFAAEVFTHAGGDERSVAQTSGLV